MLEDEYALLRQQFQKGPVEKWCSEIKNMALKAKDIDAIWYKRIIPNFLNDTALFNSNYSSAAVREFNKAERKGMTSPLGEYIQDFLDFVATTKSGRKNQS